MDEGSRGFACLLCVLLSATATTAVEVCGMDVLSFGELEPDDSQGLSLSNDVADLQVLLDRGGDVVFPSGDYVVAKTLVIHGGTHLVCQNGFRARLAEGANCAILANRLRGDVVESDISIRGGLWDGNNVHQVRAKYDESGYAPGLDFYDKPLKCGQLMVLSGVKGLSLCDMTFKDPQGYCLMLTDVEDFVVSNIVFDCNDRTRNEDGVHINGYARRGRIFGLRGHTNDDLVALNSDEGDWRSADNAIEDVLIEDLDGGDRGYTAVRLLSRDAQVRNVTIRNIHGKFQNNLVSFTHWAKEKYKFGMGHFDNITIEDVTATSSRKSGGTHGGLIWFQDGVHDVGSVVIRRLNRVEGREYLNTTPTIEIGAGTRIRSLTLEDVRQCVPDGKPLLRKHPTARVEQITKEEIGQ